MRTRKTDGVAPPRNHRLETQDEPIFQFKFKVLETLMSQLKVVRQKEFLLLTGGSAFCVVQAFH